MKISEYDSFVQETDQSSILGIEERKHIAVYGLASEIGSIASAIKKKLLDEDGSGKWDAPNAEIVEELGDAMWYCFALAKIANIDSPVNIFIHDVRNLVNELSALDDRSDQIRGVIGPENREAFLAAAESFRRSTRTMTFSDYQSITILTARTEKRVLAGVCIAVLYQLSAEILRTLLPDLERELNRSLRDRPVNDILGDTAWHLAALASVYALDLNVIAEFNIEKVSFRQNRNHPPLVHDNDFPAEQRFPREFEIQFVSRDEGRAQMYFRGEPLGDTLTDNSYHNDGYRFHDVMHLANIAHLGWSPVVRGLMGRKRKADRKTDEIEDGARAKIVEEAVIKAIHSEGQRLAGNPNSSTGAPIRLFPHRSQITFKFLNLIRNLVDGLEVSKNRFWEWEDAIFEGYGIYHQLRQIGQGTVSVNLDARSLTFEPDVFISLRGRVVGYGVAQAPIVPVDADPDADREARIFAKKKAILASLGLNPEAPDAQSCLALVERDDGEVSVRSSLEVQAAVWDKKAIAFRTTAVKIERYWICSALALTDD
ncbi:TPA: hypothetical protein QDZ10_003407 [Stenotrophomonas maltophilia]|nr:hypothetical protein [Stenotrophomonas maltophilia]